MKKVVSETLKLKNLHNSEYYGNISSITVNIKHYVNGLRHGIVRYKEIIGILEKTRSHRGNSEMERRCLSFLALRRGSEASVC